LEAPRSKRRAGMARNRLTPNLFTLDEECRPTVERFLRMAAEDRLAVSEGHQ
jgi:hypothetical protein